MKYLILIVCLVTLLQVGNTRECMIDPNNPYLNPQCKTNNKGTICTFKENCGCNSPSDCQHKEAQGSFCHGGWESYAQSCGSQSDMDCQRPDIQKYSGSQHVQETHACGCNDENGCKVHQNGSFCFVDRHQCGCQNDSDCGIYKNKRGGKCMMGMCMEVQADFDEQCRKNINLEDYEEKLEERQTQLDNLNNLAEPIIGKLKMAMNSKREKAKEVQKKLSKMMTQYKEHEKNFSNLDENMKIRKAPSMYELGKQMEEKRNASPTKANGDNCMSDSECISGNCDAVMFACMASTVELIATPSSFLQVSTQELVENGGNCMSDSECVSGNCDQGMFACMAAVQLVENGGNCMSDSECVSGNCDQGMFACMAAVQLSADGDNCMSDSDCQSGSCSDSYVCEKKLTADGDNCMSDNECQSGKCGEGWVCEKKQQQLSADGVGCMGDMDCQSGHCNTAVWQCGPQTWKQPDSEKKTGLCKKDEKQYSDWKSLKNDVKAVKKMFKYMKKLSEVATPEEPANAFDELEEQINELEVLFSEVTEDIEIVEAFEPNHQMLRKSSKKTHHLNKNKGHKK